MEYQLTGLKEHILFIGQPKGNDGQTNFTINWSFDLDITMPEDNRFAVKIDATINVAEPKDHPPIGQFSASHYFSAFDVEQDFSTSNEGKDMFNFLATIVGVSLGSMRGLSYARTVGVLGGGVFMPIVNPSELLKLNLAQIITRMESRLQNSNEVVHE
ncbi:MAG: hypothetical protein AB8H12_04445 [Lewinella sp.]